MKGKKIYSEILEYADSEGNHELNDVEFKFTLFDVEDETKKAIHTE